MDSSDTWYRLLAVKQNGIHEQVYSPAGGRTPRRRAFRKEEKNPSPPERAIMEH